MRFLRPALWKPVQERLERIASPSDEDENHEDFKAHRTRRHVKSGNLPLVGLQLLLRGACVPSQS